MPEMHDICKTCGQTWDWHQQHTDIRHPFNEGNRATSETFGKRLPDGTRTNADDTASLTVQEAPWPFDPVLRQALIDRGVITPDDLVNAERTIRAVTAMIRDTSQHYMDQILPGWGQRDVPPEPITPMAVVDRAEGYVDAKTGRPITGMVSRNDVFIGKIMLRTEWEKQHKFPCDNDGCVRCPVIRRQ